MFSSAEEMNLKLTEGIPPALPSAPTEFTGDFSAFGSFGSFGRSAPAKTDRALNRLRRWWQSVPVGARAPHYRMASLVAILRVPQTKLAPLLRSEGWRRCTLHLAGSKSTVWVPPG